MGSALGCACRAKAVIWHSDDAISILAQAKAPHENGKTSPPSPRPGGERLLKERLVLEKTRCGERPVGGGGREPLHIFSVFRPVWISLGFVISPKRAAMAGTASVSSHQYR